MSSWEYFDIVLKVRQNKCIFLDFPFIPPIHGFPFSNFGISFGYQVLIKSTELLRAEVFNLKRKCQEKHILIDHMRSIFFFKSLRSRIWFKIDLITYKYIIVGNYILVSNCLKYVIHGVNVNFIVFNPEVADKLIQSYLCTVWYDVTFHNKTPTFEARQLLLLNKKFVERLKSSHYVIQTQIST